MKKIERGYRLPSAAYTIPRRVIKGCTPVERPPAIGELLYGQLNIDARSG